MNLGDVLPPGTLEELKRLLGLEDTPTPSDDDEEE